jgi:hypothetical protein
VSWGAADTRRVSRKQGGQACRQTGIGSVDSRKLPRDGESDRQPVGFSSVLLTTFESGSFILSWKLP